MQSSLHTSKKSEVTGANEINTASLPTLRAVRSERPLLNEAPAANESGTLGAYGLDSREKDPSLRVYSRDVDRHGSKNLTEFEEIQLVKRMRRGDEVARNELINRTLRLVMGIAKNFEGLGLPLQDLYSEGNIGLMKAVDRFDPSHDSRLTTYAKIWIEQRIRRALSDQSRTIRLPVHLVAKLYHLRKAEAKLEDQLGRIPTDKEISGELKLPEKTIAELRNVGHRPKSLDERLNPDDPESDTFGDHLDSEVTLPGEEIALREDAAMMLEAFQRLPERERIILTARFRLDGRDKAPSSDELSKEFGISGARVRQLEQSGIVALRRIMSELGAQLPERLMPTP